MATGIDSTNVITEVASLVPRLSGGEERESLANFMVTFRYYFSGQSTRCETTRTSPPVPYVDPMR